MAWDNPRHGKSWFPRTQCVWGLSVFPHSLHACLGCLVFALLVKLRLQKSEIKRCKCARLGPLNVQMPDLLGVTL